MQIINTDRLPAKVRGDVVKLVTELCGIYGDGVVSILAYGSVTGPDFDLKTSDINIAVVLKDASLDALKPALMPLKKAARKKISAPLFLTTDYIKRSLDSFPIEFMSMKDSRCVLFGEDVFSGIEVKKEDLRRECETQLKGKLVTIKQAYLEQALAAKGLEALISSSLRALFPVFRNVLRIRSGETPPASKEEVLNRLKNDLGIDVSSFLEALKGRRAGVKIRGVAAETFLKDFLAQLEKLSDAVDRI